MTSTTLPLPFCANESSLVRLYLAGIVLLYVCTCCRAHFPPAVSAEEHEALGPHLDALINLLHSHSLQ